ncbi:MAG: nodulation protein NfeD [Deltaproteobacteria bacterium]|nr:nodulation protein NfeD [Deltaproteobacteria bacterium]MCL5276253.1 nodulation protein NfeD [Deltaproteobacteria bacterium]
MKRFILFMTLLVAGTHAPGPRQHVDLVSIDGPIGPAYVYLMARSIKRAESDHANAVLVTIDTPGGLDASMRSIVKSIEDADLPVIAYVSPSGSRAASAGVFIVMSSDVAAMAPGTNIGAAHPVTIGQKLGKEMEKKVTNDAVAYIKGLAAQKGRNAEWAARSVRKSVSVPAEEALRMHVVDVIAPTIPALLEKIDGMKITKTSGVYTLHTKGAAVNRINMTLSERVLLTISDPNIAYLLMIVGMWGMFFELASPGAIFPGVIGALSLILAFVSFQTIPVNYGGILLILLSIVLFILEVKIVSHGMLAVGGIVSFVLGSLLLFDTSSSSFSVSWVLILTAAALTALFFIVALGLALKVRLQRPKTGREGLVGQNGVVKGVDGDRIKVFLDGAYWDALSDQKDIKVGDKIVIDDVNSDMVVKIRKKED